MTRGNSIFSNPLPKCRHRRRSDQQLPVVIRHARRVAQMPVKMTDGVVDQGVQTLGVDLAALA